MSREPPRTGDAGAGVADPRALSPLLQHIARASAVTRADLARATGLSRSTVSQRVEALLDSGLIAEDGTVPSDGGRPGYRLFLNPSAGLIITADLGATWSRVAVSDLGGTERASAASDLTINQEPELVLGRIDERAAELLSGIGCDAGDVRAIVVGLPAPVEFATGAVVRPPLMGRWDGYCIPSYFGSRYDADTIVDNDVNLMALGEHQAIYPDVDHLLFVKVGTGIGAGMIADRRLYRGAHGAAGDLGHIRVASSDAACNCGHSGCLEAVAGGQALARQLTDQGLPAATARDVARLAAEGDPRARYHVRVAAQQIGEVLAAIVSFANPAVIVLGGPLAELDEALLAGTRSEIFGRALPLATGSLRIEASKLRERAGTVGAITLAQQHVLSEQGIATLIRARPPKHH